MKETSGGATGTVMTYNSSRQVKKYEIFKHVHLMLQNLIRLCIFKQPYSIKSLIKLMRIGGYTMTPFASLPINVEDGPIAR